MNGAEFGAALAAAQDGDEAAVVVLYRELNPALTRFLEAQATGLGQDLAQEVWLAAARGLGSFSGDERGFRAWMFTIARRRVVAHWRKGGAHVQAVDPAELAERAGAVGDLPEAALLEEDAVRVLVAGLPPEQAEIVLLRVVAGFDAEEVGAIVGQRAGTVRVLQHRALKTLRQRFAEQHVTN